MFFSNTEFLLLTQFIVNVTLTIGTCKKVVQKVFETHKNAFRGKKFPAKSTIKKMN